MRIADANKWKRRAESLIKKFEREYSSTYVKQERKYFALFEIGCFLTLLDAYRKNGFLIKTKNLNDDGNYRYLTTPSGNPDNFSYILLSKNSVKYQLRQQVRIAVSKDKRIYFTPDIVVIQGNPKISHKKDDLYANGKRSFFYVTSKNVIAAHECKCLEPFPELFASFIGMHTLAHDWRSKKVQKKIVEKGHLAPSLFVGGKARGFHLEMIAAYEKHFHINIITNLHSGFETLKDRKFIEIEL